ncbi:MAG TPA: TetR family transcriptional regulator [Bacteroidetes bacterium]|jgi:TetR/AcrR family transcriptional regulator, cholesterol catabolism regulator|nr:TetR family transcriptional regulator [Bacteroidota bacterium]|tara:strand:- start:2365 stop:2940 length:576 start_codon:yes stop_codon:yes gene_type:complete
MTERKREILAASQNVLKEKGYAATSVRDIAKALSMEPASLYSHFKSKEDILKITCFDMADKLELGIAEVNDIYFNAEEKLRIAINLHVKVLTQNLNSAMIFIRDWRNLTGKSLDQFILKRNAYEAGFREIVQTGINEGIFNETDKKFAALTILSSVNWIVEWYKEDGSLSSEQIATKLSDFILSGLKKDTV